MMMKKSQSFFIHYRSTEMFLVVCTESISIYPEGMIMFPMILSLLLGFNKGLFSFESNSDYFVSIHGDCLRVCIPGESSCPVVEHPSC